MQRAKNQYTVLGIIIFAQHSFHIHIERGKTKLLKVLKFSTNLFTHLIIKYNSVMNL